MEKGNGVIELRDPLHKTQALQPPHDFRESIMFRPECRKVHAPLKEHTLQFDANNEAIVLNISH